MSLNTNSNTPEQRVAVSDSRFDMRTTENFGDDNKGSTSWTWIAAILIAAAFIVSGYLDQESGEFDGNTAAGTVQSYAASTAVPVTLVAAVNSTDHRATKGY